MASADYISSDTLTTKPILHTLKIDNAPLVKSWMSLADLYQSRLFEKFGFFAPTLQRHGDGRETDKRLLLPGALSTKYLADPSMQDAVGCLCIFSLGSD